MDDVSGPDQLLHPKENTSRYRIPFIDPERRTISKSKASHTN